MAKYRCPSCGAAHKEQETHCRLCGTRMTDPTSIPASVSARPAPAKKRGLGTLALIGLGGVLLIGVLAVLLGVTGDDTAVVDAVRDQVPGLKGPEYDGWKPYDDADGGFTAMFPGDVLDGFQPYPPADDGRMDRIHTDVGAETTLSVSYSEVPVSDATPKQEQLRTFAQSWAEALGGTLSKDVTEKTFRGQPALLVTVKGLKQGGQPATARALLVLRGKMLYVIQSQSAYQDHPSFDRLVNSITFTT
ncbi:MAG: zinc ribbon domain-containing protein [Acidimicrobiales bacterium]